MKRSLLMRLSLALFVVGTLFLSGCTVVQPDPGEEAVLIDRPLIFGDGGIRDYTVKQGREYTWFSTDVMMVPTAPQTVEVSFDDYSSKDNILLDFKTNVQFRVTDAALLTKKFGPKWFDNNIYAQYASIVRDVVKTEKMSDMMSNAVVATHVDATVTERIRALVKEQGIPVEIMNISLGAAKPNPNVLNQMNATAAEQQRLLTLTAATAAEGQRKLEQIAKADADDAYRSHMNMDVQQYVALQLADKLTEACKAAAQCVLVPGGNQVIVGTK